MMFPASNYTSNTKSYRDAYPRVSQRVESHKAVVFVSTGIDIHSIRVLEIHSQVLVHLRNYYSIMPIAYIGVSLWVYLSVWSPNHDALVSSDIRVRGLFLRPIMTTP